MKITYFRIENFRNITLAECENPPDFIVICGGNGAGKSTILNALMTAKEHVGSYGNFEFDQRAVSADAETARIIIRLSFSEVERDFVKHQWNIDCPEVEEIEVEIAKNGTAKTTKRSKAALRLLSWYSASSSYSDSPGFFDYIDAHRVVPKKRLTTWSPNAMTEENAKQNLASTGSGKFQFTKEYLASLVMTDLQTIQAAQRAGKQVNPDSLKPIRDFFDSFFAPMRFEDVLLHEVPFRFVVKTPKGDIDIDDMSSGEKEILNAFVRFHQLRPKGAVILFDEADAHLHPDLERRYLEVLRDLSKGNQLWVTTHSPEMMVAAGSNSLYTVLKYPPSPGANQFVKVSASAELHRALAEVLGSRGLVSFNQRIVFIEGQEASADREIYEQLYPPARFNISFVPAGNSGTVRRIAERVNDLLSSGTGFQQYYSIVDGDIQRAVAPSSAARLFQLPVYHVENFLLDETLILQVLQALLRGKNPLPNSTNVESKLKSLALDDRHMRPFTAALLDAEVAKVAKEAYDAIYKKTPAPLNAPSFAAIQPIAEKLVKDAIAAGTWKSMCKGRELLKAFASDVGLDYEPFRNAIISRMASPPKDLDTIMKQVLT